jgi:hypothetical protein
VARADCGSKDIGDAGIVGFRAARAYCSRFNFSGTDQQKKVSQMSGGERNRVHLARMLKSGANLLLLDEPTNDLDVNATRCGGHAPLRPPSRRLSPPSPQARAGEAGRSLCARSRARAR